MGRADSESWEGPFFPHSGRLYGYYDYLVARGTNGLRAAEQYPKILTKIWQPLGHWLHLSVD